MTANWNPDSSEDELVARLARLRESPPDETRFLAELSARLDAEGIARAPGRSPRPRNHRWAAAIGVGAVAVAAAAAAAFGLIPAKPSSTPTVAAEPPIRRPEPSDRIPSTPPAPPTVPEERAPSRETPVVRPPERLRTPSRGTLDSGDTLRPEPPRVPPAVEGPSRIPVERLAPPTRTSREVAPRAAGTGAPGSLERDPPPRATPSELRERSPGDRPLTRIGPEGAEGERARPRLLPGGLPDRRGGERPDP